MIKKLFELLKSLFLSFAKSEAKDEFEAAAELEDIERALEKYQLETDTKDLSDSELDAANDDLLDRLRKSGH